MDPRGDCPCAAHDTRCGVSQPVRNTKDERGTYMLDKGSSIPVLLDENPLCR
jgi:hypothetical protein